MRDIISILVLFASYVVYNRIVTIPTGLALHLTPLEVFGLVFLLDMAQVPLFNRLYEKGTRLKLLSRLNLQAKAEGTLATGKLGRWAQHLGAPGVAVLAYIPCVGGGMWSAVLLARLLGLSRKVSYFYLAVGSFLGCFTLTFAGKASIQIFHQVVNLLSGKT